MTRISDFVDYLTLPSNSAVGWRIAYYSANSLIAAGVAGLTFLWIDGEVQPFIPHITLAFGVSLHGFLVWTSAAIAAFGTIVSRWILLTLNRD